MSKTQQIMENIIELYEENYKNSPKPDTFIKELLWISNPFVIIIACADYFETKYTNLNGPIYDERTLYHLWFSTSQHTHPHPALKYVTNNYKGIQNINMKM